jgi:hypothetical protein
VRLTARAAGKLPWRLEGPRGAETADGTGGPIIADDMLFVRERVVPGR